MLTKERDLEENIFVVLTILNLTFLAAAPL